jgi:RNA 2',3'-cyclic 3'-phosphodiesterase
MARLFVAVRFPEWAVDRLAEATGGLPGADWTESEAYHLTLRFLGETDEAVFSGFRKSLEALSANSFFVNLKGLGVFPLRGDPDTLWAGVERNVALQSLRNKVESIAVRNGIPPESRKFHPHVTLARVRDCRPDWVGTYLVTHSLLSIPEIPIQSFGLYSSKLGPEGAVHTLEREYMLNGLLEAD